MCCLLYLPKYMEQFIFIHVSSFLLLLFLFRCLLRIGPFKMQGCVLTTRASSFICFRRFDWNNVLSPIF